jgi:ERCC4-type nuclease
MSLILDRREAVDKYGAPTELFKALKRYDVDVISDLELDDGDLMFSGNGANGDCLVGVERKRPGDLANSMKDRRLVGKQIRGMWKVYDYCFLIVEGVWRPGPGGEVEELRGKDFRPLYANHDRYAVNYRQLAAFINSLSLRSCHERTGEPLRIIRTSNPRHTAAEYVALYLGFTEKTWDQHHAHDQIYTEVSLPKRQGFGPAKKVTPTWKMLAQLNGIDRKAEQASEHFRSMRDAVLAGLSVKLRKQIEEYFETNPKAALKAWMEVKGIGKKLAEDAVRVLAEGE